MWYDFQNFIKNYNETFSQYQNRFHLFEKLKNTQDWILKVDFHRNTDFFVKILSKIAFYVSSDFSLSFYDIFNIYLVGTSTISANHSYTLEQHIKVIKSHYEYGQYFNIKYK